MLKKKLEYLAFLPFNLINFVRLSLLELFLDCKDKIKVPKSLLKLFHIV